MHSRIATRYAFAAGLAAWAFAAGHAATPTSAASAAPPTFAKDIAPIVYANCATCHRPGQAAPFSLLSYDDVKRHGESIVKVTASRYMPPWHATQAEGFPAFREDRTLSAADIDTLKAWVDAGMPAGDSSKTPKVPTFPEGWVLGKPDLVLTLSRTIDVPADGPDLFRNVILPLDLPDDKWIAAVDFEPSARSVVHHALFFAGPADAVVEDDDLLPGVSSSLLAGLNRLERASAAGGGAATSGAATSASAPRPGASAEAFGGIGGWVPGMTPHFFPTEVGQSLPAHSNIVVQLHLHPSGKAEHEHGQLAIYFAKTKPAMSLTGVQVPPMFGFAMGIDIPAGQTDYTIKDSFVLPVDVKVFGARGHAHYLAKDMKMTATLPDGTTRGMLWISDWDFGWQDSYFYKEPFSLPKGTRIDTTIVYNNSESNPRNPNTPATRVKWGRESFDEMGSMTLMVAASSVAETTTLKQASSLHFRQQLTAMALRGRGRF